MQRLSDLTKGFVNGLSLQKLVSPVTAGRKEVGAEAKTVANMDNSYEVNLVRA